MSVWEVDALGPCKSDKVVIFLTFWDLCVEKVGAYVPVVAYYSNDLMKI